MRLLIACVLLMMSAALAAEPALMPANKAEPRIERQIEELITLLHGKKVGLVTNPTGVDSQFNLVADRLHEDTTIQIVSFFAPEHGLRGDRQAGATVDDYTDSVTGLPVYSLYGVRKQPTPEQMAPLDVLVFDIQDVGARFYTYDWTMSYALEACAAAGKPFVILDRPNPIGLQKVEGAPTTIDAGSIGRVWPGQPFGVSTRTGLTVGELATLINEEWLETKANLTVVRVPDYTRDMTFEQTGYPWVIPSPNMPTIDTALVYPGLCIFEGTNMSEGRGTTRPFELIGAPFVNGTEYAAALNALSLPGVRFRAAYFAPTFSKHDGANCGGVQVHVTDSAAFDPVLTGLSMAKTAYTMYPGNVTFSNSASRLMGVPDLQTRLTTESVEAIIAGWQANLEAFKALRAKHLLYAEPAASAWKVK